MNTASTESFLVRHEFLVRRLHSLTGLIPVGAYMVVHLTVNMTAWDQFGGPAMFQRAVYQIHSLGGFLPFVEWTFILLPILFHGVLGLAIIRSGLPNSGSYPYAANVRYTLQRVTGILAFIYIVYHVFHLHGWFHFEAWTHYVAEPLGGKMFRPYSAASTLRVAMQSLVIRSVYVVGVLACVYHLANGMWTMGITWGAWTSPAAQRRAGFVCLAIGIFLAMISTGAFLGAVTTDVDAAVQVEDAMYRAKLESGEIDEETGGEKRASEPPRLSAGGSSSAPESIGTAVAAGGGSGRSRADAE